MYLKITNKGTVERELWELVGATDKDKNDNSLIGFKGSGAKFAVIPALRLGLNPVITSWNSAGQYTLRFFTKKTSLGFEQILLDYNNGKEIKTTSFATNALQDWDKPIGDDPLSSFKALREFIVNAYDEDKNFRIEKVEKIEPSKEGYTSVYLGWDDEFNEILLHPERYFKFLAQIQPLTTIYPHAEDSREWKRENYTVNLYPRSDKKHVRVFIQGVLTYCKRGIAAFDYSINNKDLLSEERIVKDFNAMANDVFEVLDKVRNLKYIKILLPFLLMPESFEANVISYYLNRDEFESLLYAIKTSARERMLWCTVWMQKFGEKTILGNKGEDTERDLQHLGYNIVDPGNYYLCQFLETKGVPGARKVYAAREEKKRIPWEKVSTQEQKTFQKAINILKNTYPEEVEIPGIAFFKQEEHTDNGYTDFIKREIGINVKLLSRGVSATLGALIHELHHIKTGHSDYDRKFRQEADNIIAKLLMREFERKDSK